MAGTLTLVDPKKIERNPENPRLIFRAGELRDLEESIKRQGILVPLSIYEDRTKKYLLDGERRWRCALKLGLPRVPVIIQPKPDRLQNIMMMFAIHNARRDWDPLPTAYKLQDIEEIFEKRHNRQPKERELAELSSLRVGMVRRLKRLLALPEEYRQELMQELEKPRSEQKLTVDHVLEASKAAAQLRKRSIIDQDIEDKLRKAIILKFKEGVIKNTVAPRKLARLARNVESGQVPMSAARAVVGRLITDRRYDIEQGFQETAAEAESERTIAQLVGRLDERLLQHVEQGYKLSESLRRSLKDLAKRISRYLGE